MKKIFGIISCVVLSLNFIACGDDNGSSAEENIEEPNSSENALSSSSEDLLSSSFEKLSSSESISSSSEKSSTESSSSGIAESSSSVESSEKSSSSVSSGNSRIIVDEENQALVYNYDGDVSFCQVDGRSLNYRTVHQTRKYVMYNYRFVGDTLVLLSPNYKECDPDNPDLWDYIDDYSTVLVGGGSDTPYGTWTMLRDYYYDFFKEKIVYKPSQSTAERVRIVEISRDNFSTGFVGLDGSPLKSFDDYTNSVFMKYLYEGMSNTGIPTGFDQFGYNYHMFEDWTKYMPEIQQNAGVEIISRTNTKVTFSLKNREYTFEVTDVFNNDYYDRGFSAVLTSNGKSCSTSYRSLPGNNMTQDMCKIENDRIPGYTEEMDFDGDTIEYIDLYIYSDNEEFMGCVRQLIK